MAFRSANQAGLPKAYKDAMNMLLANVVEFDLRRTISLNEDIVTKSLKMKGRASERILSQDYHRHDKVLITLPNTRSVKRKNLNHIVFEAMQLRFTSKFGARPQCNASSRRNYK